MSITRASVATRRLACSPLRCSSRCGFDRTGHASRWGPWRGHTGRPRLADSDCHRSAAVSLASRSASESPQAKHGRKRGRKSRCEDMRRGTKTPRRHATRATAADGGTCAALSTLKVRGCRIARKHMLALRCTPPVRGDESWSSAGRAHAEPLCRRPSASAAWHAPPRVRRRRLPAEPVSLCSAHLLPSSRVVAHLFPALCSYRVPSESEAVDGEGEDLTRRRSSHRRHLRTIALRSVPVSATLVERSAK